MAITTYYKRYRMEMSLAELPAVPDLPPDYVWLPWNDVWLETHAEVKSYSFHQELDATVFPNLASLDGCIQLMHSIRSKPGFCAQATWLIASLDGYCGTIQGVCEDQRIGSIQNLGVIPECRGFGLGTALLLKALHGFREAGLKRARLEVTARNLPAVRMYHRIGFHACKTLYREVETDYIEEDVVI